MKLASSSFGAQGWPIQSLHGSAYGHLRQISRTRRMRQNKSRTRHDQHELRALPRLRVDTHTLIIHSAGERLPCYTGLHS